MSREMEQGEGAGSDPIYVTQTQHLAQQRGTREALGRLEERMDAKLTNLEERLDNNFEALMMEIARMGRRHRHSSSSSASGFGSSPSLRSRRHDPHNHNVDHPHARHSHRMDHHIEAGIPTMMISFLANNIKNVTNVARNLNLFYSPSL